MNWIRKHRPSPATAIALAALGVALGGVAFAAIPDSNGTIHGCFQKGNGSLRVVESSGDCRANEAAITWGQQGPPGPPGASGVQKLPNTVLSDGERSVLFTAGPLTFTAHCGFNVLAPGVTTAPVNIAEVLVSTSQDHAAFTGPAGSTEDLATGAPDAQSRVDWTGTISSLPIPHYRGGVFTASAPDGTSATGALFTALHSLNRPGKCTFGGHVVESGGSG
jgi:hypothetical protein